MPPTSILYLSVQFLQSNSNWFWANQPLNLAWRNARSDCNFDWFSDPWAPELGLGVTYSPVPVKLIGSINTNYIQWYTPVIQPTHPDPVRLYRECPDSFVIYVTTSDTRWKITNNMGKTDRNTTTTSPRTCSVALCYRTDHEQIK